MTEIVSHLVVFLVGTLTGAAGTYFAEKYTDKRRRKEAMSEADQLFRTLTERMPDLLSEMKTDLTPVEHSEWREFFVIPKGVQLWQSHNTFVYEDDVENIYLNKARVLEEYGYVVDITPGNAPKFRMTDSFAQKLKAWKT